MFQIRFVDSKAHIWRTIMKAWGGKVGIMFACHMFLLPDNQW